MNANEEEAWEVEDKEEEYTKLEAHTYHISITCKNPWVHATLTLKLKIRWFTFIDSVPWRQNSKTTAFVIHILIFSLMEID